MEKILRSTVRAFFAIAFSLLIFSISLGNAQEQPVKVTLMLDWFPTIANLAGIAIPDTIALDGEDISEVLKGNGKRQGKEFGYYNRDKLNAYRYGDWKIKCEFEGFPGAVWKKRVDPHPWLLINLKDDPGEQNNLAESQPQKFIEIKM